MSRAKRLLTIGHSYVVAQNRQLVDELAKAGAGRWEITAVAPDYFHGSHDLRPVKYEPSSPGDASRVQIVHAHLTRHVHLFYYAGLRSILRQGWDLVHVWEEPFVIAGTQVAALAPPKTPIVYSTFQNIPKRYPPPFNLMERYAVNRSAGWIGFGHTVADTLLRRPLYAGKPHRVIPPGVDLRQFHPDAQSRRAIRQRLGWDADEPPVTGYLGRFTAEKGLPLLMTVLDQLHRQRTPWRALFVGAGRLEWKLRRWAEAHPDQVRICTNVRHADVPAYLNSMDLLLAPSQTTRHWREQFGRMLIEAFATGLPVVGSDSGEIPFVIGDAGIILPESDVHAWGVTLSSLLQSPARRAELGLRSIERAQAFALPAVAAKNLEFFDTLIEKPSPRHAISSPRRLLSVGHSYIVAMNRRLVHEMSRAGGSKWEVTAVAPRHFEAPQDLRPLDYEPLAHEPLRVEVVPAHLSRFVQLLAYGRALKRIMAEGWDLVHAWEEPYIYAGYQIARWMPPGAALVYRTAQSLDKWYPPPFNLIEKYDLTRASGWICSGRLVAEVLGRREIYRRRPMRLIPLGVDLDAFVPDRAQAQAVFRKLSWDAAAGPAVIGYLGRFTEAKGLRLLMAALDHLTTPWRALLVGAGPLEQELRAWSSRHGDRVRICTDVRHNDVPVYLNAMDVLCAPSQTTPKWREQFGRMLIEAFACGVPVVGSDSGEIPFVIDDAGVVVGEKDQPGWTAAIDSLLNDSQRRTDLRERGLERARQFAWPVIARQYLQFFDELLESGARQR